MLITDKMVHAAFDWLKENSGTAAAARANRIRAEHNTKKVKGKCFLEAEGSNIAERDARALQSPSLDEAIDAEAEAVRVDEWHRNQRNKAEAIIEAWRTEQSNLRAMGKVA